jgi:hypothetical protein
MNSVFDMAGKIATPLALAGFFGAVLFFMLRRIVRAHFSGQARPRYPGWIPLSTINLLFVLCLAGMVVGFAAYALRLRAERPAISEAAYDRFFVTLKGSGFGLRKGHVFLHYSDGNARVSTKIGDSSVWDWQADSVKFLWPSQFQPRFVNDPVNTYHDLKPLFVLKTTSGFSSEWTYVSK